MSNNKLYFLYEHPLSAKVSKIFYSEIEEVAEESGDNRHVDDIDDDTFYKYCRIILRERD